MFSCRKVILSFAAALICQSVTASEFITIGTGGITGVYYPAGGAICRLFNKEYGDSIKCTVESTEGSIYNLNTLRNKELDFGVAQSDMQYYAYNGADKFADQGKFEDLRSVFSLHAEPFTVVARKDANIDTFDDLKGKRVNIGNPGSGQRGTMEVVMNALGWGMGDLIPSELKSAEQAKALCDGKVQAIIFTVGHPNGSIKEATTTCDSAIVPVEGAAIDKLVADNAYYRKAVVPGGMYSGTDNDVNTFGVGATLVTSASVPEDSVYKLVKSVFENFEELQKLHPAFASLKKEEMVTAGLSAPLHPGAEKYYKEIGLLK